MNILQIKSYHDTLTADIKQTYLGVTVLFRESLDGSTDEEGIIDSFLFNTHHAYAGVLQDLGEVLKRMERIEKEML